MQDLSGPQTDTRIKIPRRSQDKIHFSVNVATLASLLSGGAMYFHHEIEARAEAEARVKVLEERMIQLQSEVGEANARLANVSPR